MNLFLPLCMALASISAEPIENPRLKSISSPYVEVDARVGLGGSLDDDLPVPITLTAKNSRSEPITGYWEIEFLDYNNRTSRTIRRPEELDANMAAERRTRLYVQRKKDNMVIRLRTDDEVIWQQVMTWANIDRRSINILTVSRNRIRISFASNKQMGNVGVMPKPGERTATSHAIRSWELPGDAPPLFMYKAIVFSPDAEIPTAPAQQRALADYLFWGGTISVPSLESDIAQILRLNLPPPATVAFDSSASENRTRTRIGAGTLFTSSTTLFERTETGTGATTRLKQFLEFEPEPIFPRNIRPAGYTRKGMPPNASNTLSMVGVIVFLYSLLTGPVVWLLFRKSKKTTLMWYVGATTAVFSLIAMLVGPVLGLRKGDIQWLTMTELTPHGGVQWSMINATSAGSGRHKLGLNGSRLRSWRLPPSVYSDTRFDNRYAWQFMRGLPFDSNTNLSFDGGTSPQSEGMELQISPWGTRLILTNSYCATSGTIDVRLELTNTQTHYTVANHSGYTLDWTKLFIGVWNPNQGQDNLEFIDLGLLRDDALVKKSVPRRVQQGYWQMRAQLDQFGMYHDWKKSAGFASISIPRPNLDTIPSAYIIGRIRGSTDLSIGESSFEPNEGAHYVIQRVQPTKIINRLTPPQPVRGM